MDIIDKDRKKQIIEDGIIIIFDAINEHLKNTITEHEFEIMTNSELLSIVRTLHINVICNFIFRNSMQGKVRINLDEIIFKMNEWYHQSKNLFEKTNVN